jgi:hypothetical protein
MSELKTPLQTPKVKLLVEVLDTDTKIKLMEEQKKKKEEKKTDKKDE